jgi:hypothetical protein
MKIALAIAAFAGMSLTALAAEDIARYPHQVVLEAAQQANWYQLDIPMSVQWQAAHADLRDLRVFNAEGESLPYALVQRAAPLSGAAAGDGPAPLVWSPLLAGEPVPEPGHEREFIWQFPHGLPLERVAIEVAEVNTLASVIFSGRLLVPPVPVSAPASAESKPLAAEVLRGERRVRNALKRDKRKRRRQSSAPVAAAEPSWRTLVSGDVYRLPAGTGEGAGEQVAEELDLPGVSVNQLRLQIDPRSSGLGVQAPPRIKVAVRGWELTFLARGSAPFRLAYGRADAAAAGLPLSTLIPAGVAQATESGQLGRAAVAGEALVVPVPAAVLAPEARPDSQEEDAGSTRKAVLWGVLLAGVALLVGMAVSLLRSTNGTSGTSGTSGTNGTNGQGAEK